jgi:flagellar hook-basal body complex protein FliE
MTDLRIAALAPPMLPSAITAPVSPAGARGGESFGETLTRALASVNDLQLQARDATVALASGGEVDSAQALVAVEKASVSFQFALQIRNKLLEAYQEIMRMTV